MKLGAYDYLTSLTNRELDVRVRQPWKNGPAR